MSSGSDFRGVKVGDRLWLRDNFYEGWVEVTIIYPTCFKVSGGPSFEHWISKSGRWDENGPQVLFYDKVEIVPPPRPKSLVKKTVTVRPYLDPHTQTIEVTSHLNCVLDYCGPIQKIEIEVEEEP
jgi:hypothetical protein